MSCLLGVWGDRAFVTENQCLYSWCLVKFYSCEVTHFPNWSPKGHKT